MGVLFFLIPFQIFRFIILYFKTVLQTSIKSIDLAIDHDQILLVDLFSLTLKLKDYFDQNVPLGSVDPSSEDAQLLKLETRQFLKEDIITRADNSLRISSRFFSIKIRSFVFLD